MDLATLQIERLIVHDIPLRLVKQKSGGTVPSALDPDIRAYFGCRLTQTLERNGAAVEHDPHRRLPTNSSAY